jgi:lysophospholipase L1-like esterase
MEQAKHRYERMVCIGDSITSGRKATLEQRCWINRLGALISEFQDCPVTLFNQGIGANVLVDSGPAYEYSQKPSGRQRLGRDVISCKPDLVTLAFGTNDLRGGTPIPQFISDLEYCIIKIKEQTQAVVVVLSTYAIKAYSTLAPWNHATPELFKIANQKIQLVCERYGTAYVDVFSAMAQAPWTVDQDQVHPNDLGHALIANRVFEGLCQYNSWLSCQAYKNASGEPMWRQEGELRRTDNLNEF